MKNNVTEYTRELSAQNETRKHILQVQDQLLAFVQDLGTRAIFHDNSKLHVPEIDTFARHTEKLKELDYGSEAYRTELALMKPALDHHYSNNRHHPEHFKNGIDGMTLVDLVEMLADWKAATLRHDTGCIKRSLEINAKRFGISEQLLNILDNTVNEYLE